MIKFDSLKPADEVTVTIMGPDDKKLFEATNSDYHSLENAISAAISDASLEIDPKDCVFVVTNNTTNVSHRYRLNSHDNLKLII